MAAELRVEGEETADTGGLDRGRLEDEDDSCMEGLLHPGGWGKGLGPRLGGE